MSVKVGINGFGRIGSCAFRSNFDNKEVEFVAINDLMPPKTLAYLLKHNTNYGAFEKEVDYTNDSIVIQDKEIKVYQQKDPKEIPWEEIGVEVVIESTGLFTDANDAQRHLEAGAKKCIISAPANNEDFTVVLGVNDDEYDNQKHNIVSNASCTTNCLAPVVKVLNDKFGIERAQMTTIHSYTNSQNILDGPYKWEKITRGRTAAENIIPTTTGAAKATTVVLPELKGKIDGMAVRVPTPVGSLVDMVAELQTNVTAQEVNNLIKKVSKNSMNGIIEYNEEPIVSRDIFGNAHSSIFDANYTNVIDENQLKVLIWYDNEWGYANRVIDLAIMMKEKGL